jgi:hypothetical protein
MTSRSDSKLSHIMIANQPVECRSGLAPVHRMSAPAIRNLRGSPLSEQDYQALAVRWIDREGADRQMLRRVISIEGAEILGRNGSGNYAGVAIPYIWPGDPYVRDYRIRRDNPEYENGKPKQKYMTPPGRGNFLYLPVGIEVAWLTDTALPIVLTEGEFKAIALTRAAWSGLGESAERPRFFAAALSGVWNWRGVIGKVSNEDGVRVDEKGPIPDLARVAWKDRTVTIVFDRDADSNDSVGIARSQLVRELQSRGAVVKVFSWPTDHSEAKGIDDLLATIGPDQALTLISKARKRKPLVRVDDGGWRKELIFGASGEPTPVLANAMLALRTAPDWEGVLQHDIFAIRSIAAKPTPWGFVGKWTDQEDARACEWLQKRRILVPRTVASEAIEAVARLHEIHPVRQYLDGLQWDGVPRIGCWLHTYLCAEDSNYTRAVGQKWLISGVARIRKPGVKVDSMLITEGPQGLGKSSVYRVLGGEWFTDDIADLGSKDSAMQVAGVWILEIAELDSMSRPDASKIKAFMSRATDRFRPPYGRRLIEAPRQCIFGGSVNASTYLKDETGARRFWPVKCGRIDLEALARDRDQLWAEAAEQHRLGVAWWLDSPELMDVAKEEQDARYDGDPWEGMISKWVDNPCQRSDQQGYPVEFGSTRNSIVMDDVLTHCIGKRGDQWTQADKNRVGRCLRSLGFELKLKRDGQARAYRYVRCE